MPVPPNTLRVHTEYVLVKSVPLKVLRTESRVQGIGENFPPLQFHASIAKVEIDGGAIYRNVLSSLREFHRAKIVLSPEWCSRLRPTTGVHLVHCHDEFRGPRSDYVRQVVSTTQQK
ncbi:uncharacterized protein TNCV_793331 [Trichonephila clavipes]|nr:uncharacterized protein TNCV_793331 [Trichonephila clavipes]